MFGASDEKDKDKEKKQPNSETEESSTDKPEAEGDASPDVVESSPFEEDTEEAPKKDDQIVDAPSGEETKLEEEFEITSDGDTNDDKAKSEDTNKDESSDKPGGTKETETPSAPAEEQIVLHTEGEDLFAIDGVPDDLDILMPIKPSRYQKECFLKFGFDEIDARLSIEDVNSYLRVRGWSNSDLTKARRRTELEDNLIDLNAENFCDFCGVPLTGVSFDRLADGRTRCNDCSMTAINEVDEFRELFRNAEMMMENTFNITIPASIAVKTTDARTIAKHTGQVFTPSTKVAARVLGFAQRKGGKYSLFIENGSPRLAAVDTTTHEMTHIWQYLNWNDGEIIRIYRQYRPALTKMARDIVYEGMAMWSAIQMLYAMGETYYAQQQEQLAAARNDIYGIGFRLYRDRYDLTRNGDAPVLSPFASFPPLDPAEVKKVFEEVD